MNILGISCYYHDAAAALICDGQVVAAAAEERFSRLKHDAAFPRQAIAYCIKEAGLSLRDVSHVVFYEKPIVKFDRLLTSILATWPRSYPTFIRSVPLWLRSRLRIDREIRTLCPAPVPLLFSEHHLSHGAYAFFASPLPHAALLTLDGVGEWTCGTAGYGQDLQITLEQEMRFPHSLGLLYSALTAYLGFEVNDAEWKVMGLASSGRPRYLEQFSRLIDLAEDGSFRLNMSYFAFHHSSQRMYSRAFVSLFGEPPRPPESEITEFHRDMARSGQELLEKIICRAAAAVTQRYHTDALCLGGGVALNCVANFKILEQTTIKQLHIQPAPGDDGGAVGAALYLCHHLLGHPRRMGLGMPYWGPSYSAAEIEAALRQAGVSFHSLERTTLLEMTARHIHQGQVVGWFQGRMEFGPRALGNRSILASPLRAEMKDILNAKVKFRETFRPFAPAVLHEQAHEYFELGEGVESPYMLLAPPVKKEKQAIIPAVTHDDGTGRVQTVRREQNPLFYDLIAQVGTLSGIPVVVNTSFNLRGEPIVCTPQDAVACFLRSGIDVLVMGQAMVLKAELAH